MKVVTYQDDRGGNINICLKCETKLKEAHEWPKNSVGQEYCTVSHGLHEGECDLCGDLCLGDTMSEPKQVGLWILMTQGGEIFTYGNEASTDVPFANEDDAVDQAKYLYEKANDKDPVTCYLLRTFDNGQVKTEIFDEDQMIEEGN